jgi:hypothetical protein
VHKPDCIAVAADCHFSAPILLILLAAVNDAEA